MAHVVNVNQPIQYLNQLPNEEPSICDRILKIGGIALAALACVVLFTLSPLSAAITTAVWLNNYYRNRGEDTLGRSFLNGILAASAYNAFSLLNAQLFMII